MSTENRDKLERLGVDLDALQKTHAEILKKEPAIEKQLESAHEGVTRKLKELKD